MPTTEPAFLSVAETAQRLGLSEATVYRRVWDGSLPVLRLSDHGAIRIPVHALTSDETAVEPPLALGGDAA